MRTKFQNVDEVLADEGFHQWYNNKQGDLANDWAAWVKANPDQQFLVNEAITLMNQLSLAELRVSESHTEEQLGLLRSRLEDLKAPVVKIDKPVWKRRWIAVAAAILLLAGMFTVYNIIQPSGKHIDAYYGEIKTNELPDGSTMILNANSSAKLSEGWKEGKDREVWLDGEAFFKVTKTPQKSRFIVHTQNLDVIVTGTQFNVLHRNNKTTVLLTEGSVILRTGDGKELAMKPGDYVEMDNMLVERKQAKEENILAWKENKIVFENTPLATAVQQIKDHYGVTIQLADESLKEKNLTGIMSNNNLEDLLKAIEVAAEIQIRRNGSAIVFARE
jgi:transmembrane sensor